MHITEKIKRAGGKTLLSFEILPPALGSNSMERVNATVRELATMNPAYINITYHSRQQKKVVKKDDRYVLTSVVKRPGTIGLCAAIQAHFKIDTVPHIICTDHDASEIEDKLIETDYLGIDNLLALRGDKLKYQEHYEPKLGGHRYAIDLVRQVKNMNQGIFTNEVSVAGKTNFCIGVAGYPETHLEAKSYEEDLRHLKNKVDAGADFIVTQMFFDNEKFLRFRDDCIKMGISIPIIPGLKNLTKKKQLSPIARIFGTTLPNELVTKFENTKDEMDEIKVGTDWCVKQSMELKREGIPALHYYTMDKVEEIKSIVTTVF